MPSLSVLIGAKGQSFRNGNGGFRMRRVKGEVGASASVGAFIFSFLPHSCSSKHIIVLTRLTHYHHTVIERICRTGVQ